MFTSHSALGSFMSKELSKICAKNLLVLLLPSGKRYSMMMRPNFCYWLRGVALRGVAARQQVMCVKVSSHFHTFGRASEAWHAVPGNPHCSVMCEIMCVCARECADMRVCAFVCASMCVCDGTRPSKLPQELDSVMRSIQAVAGDAVVGPGATHCNHCSTLQHTDVVVGPGVKGHVEKNE